MLIAIHKCKEIWDKEKPAGGETGHPSVECGTGAGLPAWPPAGSPQNYRHPERASESVGAHNHLLRRQTFESKQNSGLVSGVPPSFRKSLMLCRLGIKV